MMWEADKMTQVQMPKFARSHISTDCSVKRIFVTGHLYCIIYSGILPLFTVRFGRLFGSAWSLPFVSIFKHHRVLEKCFWGPGKSWKSPGNFWNQDSGNPETRQFLRAPRASIAGTTASCSCTQRIKIFVSNPFIHVDESMNTHIRVTPRHVKVSRPACSQHHFFGLGLGLTVIGLALRLGLMR